MHQQVLEDEHLTGIANRGYLEAAVDNPQAWFGGRYLNEDLFEMAAALLVSLACNHAFLDGNKRTALLGTWTFLRGNDVWLRLPDTAFRDLVLDVACHRKDKHGAARMLRDNSVAKPLGESVGP